MLGRRKRPEIRTSEAPGRQGSISTSSCLAGVCCIWISTLFVKRSVTRRCWTPSPLCVLCADGLPTVADLLGYCVFWSLSGICCTRRGGSIFFSAAFFVFCLFLGYIRFWGLGSGGALMAPLGFEHYTALIFGIRCTFLSDFGCCLGNLTHTRAYFDEEYPAISVPPPGRGCGRMPAFWLVFIHDLSMYLPWVPLLWSFFSFWFCDVFSAG